MIFPRFDKRLSVGTELVASAVLHAVLLAVLLYQTKVLPEPAPERSVAVNLVTAAQYAASIATVPTIVTAPAGSTRVVQPTAQPNPAPVQPPVVPSLAAPPRMVHPRQLLAAGVLAEPASKEIRETLPLLGGDERKVQLCNIEALAQIHAADARLDPDILVAYAMADMDVTAEGVVADGGAFRSQQQWYRFKFRCAVSSDLRSVTDFSYAIGDAIPKSQWGSHDLTAADQDMD